MTVKHRLNLLISQRTSDALSELSSYLVTDRNAAALRALEAGITELLSARKKAASTRKADVEGQGWLYSLRDPSRHDDGVPGSWWGNRDQLLDHLYGLPPDNGKIRCKSRVWGRIDTNKDGPFPTAGDGLAFYYSMRGNALGGAGVHLVGTVVEARTDERQLKYLDVEFDLELLMYLEHHPVLRSNPDNKRLFERIGITQGRQFALYRATPAQWKQLLKLAQGSPR